MSFESLMAASQRLSVSVETLAALGAQLRLQQEGLDGDPRVRALLNEIAGAVDPQLLEDVDSHHQAAALALIQTMFRQALDLLENPARVPGWSYQDPDILQSQGQVSRLIVRGIDAMAGQRPELSATLRRPGVFLDVGTGVGWLAIEAARSWPALRVVGIDPWEPALTLAHKNLAQSGVAERVELRPQRVEQLGEEALFTLAWLPGPFIAVDIADRALERVHRALVRGGWLIFGINPPPPGPLAEALTSLRIVRSGGYPWKSKEVEEKLQAHGFKQIEVYSPMPPIVFVVGRRPVPPQYPRSSSSTDSALSEWENQRI
jgi:ubiquinone/menaquinone biosynthesis C-methylase UbiE